MKRWVVTGGCGFIGRNLIIRLLTMEDALVRVIDDLSVGSREELSAISSVQEYLPSAESSWSSNYRLSLVTADVCDEKLALSATEGADVVVHLAGNTGVASSVSDPRRDCFSNVVGTLNYLEACRKHGVSRFVYASSGASVGNCEPPLHEELAAHPVSPYGASKLAGRPTAQFTSGLLELTLSRCGSVIAMGHYQPTKAVLSLNSSARRLLANHGKSMVVGSRHAILFSLMM